MIFFVKGRIKYFGRSLLVETFIEFFTLVIMMFVVGILLKILLAGKSCRLVFCGHLSSEMPSFGAKLVIFVSAQDLESLFMGLNSLLHLLGLLKNGALMPLGHFQGRLQVKSTSLWV